MKISQSGNQIVKLAPGTEVALPAGTQVDLAAGAQVDLAPGAEVEVSNPILGGALGESAKITLSAVSSSVSLQGDVLYRVFSTIDCFLRVGADAVADVPCIPIAARTPEYIKFPGAGAITVHGIVVDGNGTVYFVPVT